MCSGVALRVSLVYSLACCECTVCAKRVCPPCCGSLIHSIVIDGYSTYTPRRGRTRCRCCAIVCACSSFVSRSVVVVVCRARTSTHTRTRTLCTVPVTEMSTGMRACLKFDRFLCASARMQPPRMHRKLPCARVHAHACAICSSHVVSFCGLIDDVRLVVCASCFMHRLGGYFDAL